MRPIAWISEPLARVLAQRFPDLVRLSTANQFLDAPRDTESVFFVDRVCLDALASKRGLTAAALPEPVVAFCDDRLTTAIGWLAKHPWLSHVIGSSMLEHPMGGTHLDNVVSSLATGLRGRLLDWVRPTLEGQRVRLTHASERNDQLDEMAEFFARNGTEASGQLRSIADELVTNGFYTAPFAAGAVSKPVPRTVDVELPEERACDLVYGCSEDFAIVRVRDPFGSLSREQMIAALQTGHGGMWRVFNTASFIAISVVNGHHTDILVGTAKGEIPEPRPFAFHLFFKDGTKRRVWKLLEDDPDQHSFVTDATETEDACGES